MKNQLVGYGYDAAGNLTQEGSGSPSWTYTYDAENRISSIAGSASETFKYDGDGERVYKSYGAIFWRLPGGPFLTKASLSGTINSEHIYFGGRHIAIVNGTTPSYLFPDHLGGEHVVTNASGTICNDVDTLPFGGEIDYTASCGPSYIFAGMDRGNENSSDLDYAINRYFDLRMGRFMQSDPAGMMAVDIGNPQTLNRYAYALNNPLNLIDPFGLDCVYLNDSGTGVADDGLDQNSSAGECGRTGGYWVDGSATNVQIGGDAEMISLTGTTNGSDMTSASYQQNATFDVGEFHNTFINPWNHIALGLHGGTLFGQNPRSDVQFGWQSLIHNPAKVVVPGAIKPQKGGQLVNMVHIPVTGMQAQMMQDAISQTQQNPAPYSIGDQAGHICDCASWAQQILGDAGINSGPATRDPGTLIQQLRQEQEPPQQ